MKEHSMRLAPSPMKSIRNGEKTIELRLYDKKRQKIAVGDTIKFISTEDASDTLYATVEDLFVFGSFDELYRKLPLLECGYTKDNIDKASPSDMDCYYSKKEQSKYGVVGIKISLK
jgi:ASC-1-like (ASCH) protein